jgi:hypothetical protein
LEYVAGIDQFCTTGIADKPPDDLAIVYPKDVDISVDYSVRLTGEPIDLAGAGHRRLRGLQIFYLDGDGVDCDRSCRCVGRRE